MEKQMYLPLHNSTNSLCILVAQNYCIHCLSILNKIYICTVVFISTTPYQRYAHETKALRATYLRNNETSCETAITQKNENKKITFCSELLQSLTTFHNKTPVTVESTTINITIVAFKYTIVTSLDFKFKLSVWFSCEEMDFTVDKTIYTT